jgi:sulfatase maturation enzyme AslB (radical SAM superfamily)
MHDLYIKVHDNLPVFKISCGQQMVIYTPGCSIITEEIHINDLKCLLKNPSTIENDSVRNLVYTVLNKANDVAEKWKLQKLFPFTPECFTIHSGSDCNLDCSYCYSKKEQTGNKNLTGFPSEEAIEAVTEYISENIPLNSHQFTVVYHGSGEPTFHWDKLVSSFQKITGILKKKGIEIFNYIATNGCLEESQVDWLAENMDLIGLSCDGTPEIQKVQRTNRLIKNDHHIEKICKRILEKGGKFDIRVTVTPLTIKQLPEITEYLILQCNANNIRIEPVYLAGEKEFQEMDADDFFSMFNKASHIAKEYNVGFNYAGIRTSELHSTYCDVLRNTIRLSSDDLTRNCFCYMSGKEEFKTGEYNRKLYSFKLRSDIDLLKHKAYHIPDACSGCINEYHCSRGCPDFCLFENENHEQLNLSPFRCRLHKLMAVDFAIKSSIRLNTNYSPDKVDE